MNRIERAALLVAAAMSLTSPALGEDWSGFYLGVNAGHLSAASGSSGVGSYFAPEDATGYAWQADLTPEGFFGGLEAGYNWQPSDFVFGIAADVQFGSLQESATSIGYESEFIIDRLVFTPFPGSTASISQDIDWLATVRGRFGHVIGSDTMLYITGGLAFAQVSYDGVERFPARTYILDESDLKFGWTAGAGVERRLTETWSLKAEYLYFDLGGRDEVRGTPIGNWTMIADFAPLQGHIGRIGINHRF